MNEELNLYKAIKYYIKKRVNSNEIAEDLTQEVFFKLAKFENLDQIQSVKSWLFTVAKNTLIDHYKKNKVLEIPFDDLVKLPKEDRAYENEVIACLKQMILKLDKEDREILLMSDIYGESQKKLGISLNLNYSTVKSRIQRAREKLKKELLGCCTFIPDSRGVTSFCKKN